MSNKPGLYGINRSNRDFTHRESWGKNQFNSSFPASLACYMHSKNLQAMYCVTDGRMSIKHKTLSIEALYGLNPLGDDIYFSFETQYLPFQKYVTGSIPRNDLVIMSGDECISSFEIKLSALPDNSTCEMAENEYGSEIVIRPDTIVYLACSFIEALDGNREAMRSILSDAGANIDDWTDAEKIMPNTYSIYIAIKKLVKETYTRQTPLVIQPVWKTEGKSPRLAANCLDMFIWSSCGLLTLFMPSEDDFAETGSLRKITRHSRTMIWLFKMLKDFAENGQFSSSRITDELMNYRTT